MDGEKLLFETLRGSPKTWKQTAEEGVKPGFDIGRRRLSKITLRKENPSGEGMKTITVINQKGGVGKTTTAHVLATGLAKEGHRVLIVDLDNQANISILADAQPGRPGTFEMIMGKATLDEVAQETKTPGLFIAPGSLNLSLLDGLLVHDQNRGYKLRDALNGAKYDYIIIDVPPSLGSADVMALAASNYVIIPTNVETLSLEAVKLIAGTIDAVKKGNKKLKVLGLLFTRYKEKAAFTKKARPAFETVAKALGFPIFETTIRETAAMASAQAKKMAIIDYSKKNGAALDYLRFIDEVKNKAI